VTVRSAKEKHMAREAIRPRRCELNFGQYVILLSKNHRIEMKGFKCIVIKVKEVVHRGRRTGTEWKRIYEMIVKDRRILQVVKKSKGGGAMSIKIGDITPELTRRVGG